MNEQWRYTLVEDASDISSDLVVDYIGVKYTLAPNGYTVIRWKYGDQTDTTRPLLRFSIGGRELSYPVFTMSDLHEYRRLVIHGDSVNRSFGQKREMMNPNSEEWIWLGARLDGIMGILAELEKEVRICHTQCKHLLKRFQEAVDRVKRMGDEKFWDFPDRYLASTYKGSQNTTCRLQRPSLINLELTLHDLVFDSLFEGEILLRSCGESSYNQAAFALTSPPPRVPTFSKFAVAIRELSWIVDFLSCVSEGKSLSLYSWEWCEERCRLVVNSGFTNRLDTTEEDSLEADVRRQNADREALRSYLDLELSISTGPSSSQFSNRTTWFGRGTGALVEGAVVQGELESIWRKRLQTSSCAPGSFSPLDAFVIDNPESSFVQDPRFQSRSGTSKSVQKCKWLGETVAVSTMSSICKVSAQAETGLLARVQHPNVVEWMGYAYKEDLRDRNCYRDCYLVTEYMECDLHDLITERLTLNYGTFWEMEPPFQFRIALDIAFQIVEAMIHLHKCRVIHRDLKPKNILANERYSEGERTPRYSIKLIDFGSSKSGDEGSYFRTRKQGTSAYMAPEVWESEDRYSWSADVYSFGLTCFEIFTGRLPLEDGMARTHANIQKVLRHGEIFWPYDYLAELKSLLVKCWAENPSERPCFEDIRKDLWRLKVLYWSRYPGIEG